jgi:hypothetical protein
MGAVGPHWDDSRHCTQAPLEMSHCGWSRNFMHASLLVHPSQKSVATLQTGADAMQPCVEHWDVTHSLLTHARPSGQRRTSSLMCTDAQSSKPVQQVQQTSGLGFNPQADE